MPPDIASQSASANELGNFVKDIDYLLTPGAAEQIKDFGFTVDGVGYKVKYANREETHQFDMTAILGHLPFTAESAEKRQLLLDIISATRPLFRVRFTLDDQSQIIARTSFTVEHHNSPDLIFYPLVQFLQEASPFMKLIGKYI